MTTPSQDQAIRHPGNTLVMAGAGTGKTTTLINRVLHWITEADHSIDRLLLVTFTEAAAAEMRQRLRTALSERLREADKSQSERLHEQLALVEQARISTLHSFCLGLIRENFHLLGIDPDLRVLDEGQTRPMEERVLDELFAEHYAGRHVDSPAVLDLIRVQGNGSEWAIRGQVLSVYRFIRTLADPEAWLEGENNKLRNPVPDQWRQWLEAKIATWREETENRLKPVANLHDWAKLALEAVRATADPSRDVDLLARLEAIQKPGKRWPNGVAGEIKEPVNRCYEEAALLATYLLETSGQNGLERDWDLCRVSLLPLLSLVKEFDGRFAKAKRDMGGIDFSDQEQLALRLLRDPENGVAAQCRDLFQQVMVDEAQDINHAQDAILQAVSHGNRFVVGDVKQCIYQFRLTDPEIFQNLARTWHVKGEGQVVALTDNFRSREGVIDFVNALFADLMIPEVGGMRYDEAARLRFGSSIEGFASSRDAEPGQRVEIQILATRVEEGEAAGDETRAELLAVEQEARRIAARLSELKQERTEIWDAEKKVAREVEWRDMTVLLRSPGPCAEAYVREFRRMGVPLLAKRAGFYSATEIRDLLSLLSLLDNPDQDLPLLAVLRSPLAGFSPEEMARIRLQNRQDSVWRSVRRFTEEGGPKELQSKVASFLGRFADWRALSRQSSLSHCLEVVLEQTHYEALLAMADRGAERCGNVRRLLALAQQFDPWQRQGLHRFVRFVTGQMKAGIDLEPAPPSAADAVTLMSIHQSKGLEFPVVAVAGLGRKFNEGDVNASLVLDEEYKLCPMVYPDGPRLRYPSLPLELARERRRTGLRAEEGRLLYVACTRARDHLLLTGSVAKSKSKIRERMATGLPLERIGRAANMLEWILGWIGTQCDATALERDGGQLPTCRWSLVEGTSPTAAETKPGNPKSETAGLDVEAIADRLEYQYPFAGATIEAAKTSVSELRRRSREMDETVRPRFRGRSEFKLEAPKKSGIPAARRGTLHHEFLQHLDLSRAASPQELRAQAQSLIACGLLETGAAEVIEFEGVAEFFVTPLGRRIRRDGGRVERELPFTIRLRPAELLELGVAIESREMTGDDFVVVQGVVDLVRIDEDSLLLLDYKTDSVDEETFEDKVREYTPQLRLYALALSRILKRPVSGAWLHFLSARKSVDVMAV